jgi:hypothetical protein
MTGNCTPLSEAERAALQLWQRRMVRLFVAAMTLLLFALLLKALGDLPGWLELTTGAGFIILAVLGVVLQFSARCPRCGFRVGLQSRLILPPACVRCGVAFHERSRASDEGSSTHLHHQ